MRWGKQSVDGRVQAFYNVVPPDPAVEEELRAEKLIQQEAPLPWRPAEMEYLMKALGLEQMVPQLSATEEGDVKKS